MKTYIGTKIIAAEPERHSDGREGYRVVYPDGYASWSPKSTFEAAYREISFHERQLLEQTDAEHQVSRISDGQPQHARDPDQDVAPIPDRCPGGGFGGAHEWSLDLEANQYKCRRCPATRDA